MKLIAIIMTILLFSSIAEGGLSFHCSIYNSDDSVDVSLQGENLKFDGTAYLDKNSLNYNNGGSSTQPDCSYSYSVNFNGEEMTSGAQTDSGGFSFHTLVDSNYFGPDSKAYDLSLKNIVANGVLNSHYSNSDVTVSENLELDMAAYSQGAKLKPGYMESQGSGVTLQKIEDSGDENEGSEGTADDKGSSDIDKGVESLDTDSLKEGDIGTADEEEVVDKDDSTEDDVTNDDPVDDEVTFKSILHTISVEGPQKDGSVETRLQGDLNALWNCGVIFENGETAFGSLIQGIANEPAEEMEMLGKASGFPDQVLPPGEIGISYEDTVLGKEQYIDYTKAIEVARESFGKEHEGECNQDLWYYLKQKAYIPKTTSDSESTSGDPTGQLFNMRMRFAISEKLKETPTKTLLTN